MSAPTLDSSERANYFLEHPDPVNFDAAKSVVNGVAFTLVLGGVVLFVAGLATLAAAGALFAPPVAAAIGLAGIGLIAAQAAVIYIGLNIVGIGLTLMGTAAIANLIATRVFPALKKADAIL